MSESVRDWFHGIFTKGGGCMGHHFDEPAQCEHWAALVLASDWLADAKAEAWDEGYRQGAGDWIGLELTAAEVARARNPYSATTDEVAR